MAMLSLTGWAIAAHRARNGAGEIDLIARRGAVLAFIEVKTRKHGAIPVLRSEQRNRIERAASMWCSGRPWTARLQWRYDLIVVAPWRWPVHIADAWRPASDPVLSRPRKRS